MVAVITGSSRGIGLGIAKELLKKNFLNRSFIARKVLIQKLIILNMHV